ncbi:MAG: PilT/PilU family type 4a pilus ATPase [Betaproteobacteria bacterium]|nr:PilT/PilU family type 4a pilus ATPase [Betaproteobacteria bacterium]MBK9605529.1 PilT/PilU family type 4a pilus ATPase [Betaproteobacteria bacterium]
MYLDRLFQLMAEKQASDLFISCGAPINIKIDGVAMPINTQPMEPETVRRIAYEMMNRAQAERFEQTHEMNLAHVDHKLGNFRINIMRQRGSISMVIRYIRGDIPQFESLNLPPALLEMISAKRGLILIVGSTGSGKSTTMAAMLDFRNGHMPGHILTIEDPIEYLFRHRKSIVNQREIGEDTQSYHNALVNGLRAAPDVLMIGEVRDRETMQHVLIHALTGHLCMTTLHANNSYHALARIINMYPHEARPGLLSDLAVSLRAIVSQRLVRNKMGKLQPAVEIMMNSTHVSELVKTGDLDKLAEAMQQSLYPGSQTFEQALCRLYLDDVISYDEALQTADSPTNLSWLINHYTEQRQDDGSGLSKSAQLQAPPVQFSQFQLTGEPARGRP